MTPEFGRRFWEFIHDGDYEMRERKRVPLSNRVAVQTAGSAFRAGGFSSDTDTRRRGCVEFVRHTDG